MSMRPLRLTWQMASPMVAGANPLHLDAIVMFAMAEETARLGCGAQDLSLTFDLPFAKELVDEHSCWKASALTPLEPGDHGMRFWTRKSDPYDYARRMEAGHFDSRAKFPLAPGSHSQKFDTVRGGFKQMFKHYPVREIRTLEAWCVGDMDRLAELLAPEAGYITYLGSKTRMGHGRIGGFDITEDATALEHWQRRVLPWPKDGYLQVELATQPPYWDMKNRRKAWVNPDLYN